MCVRVCKHVCMLVASWQPRTNIQIIHSVGTAPPIITYFKMCNSFSCLFCRQSFTTYVCDEDVDTPITVVNGELSSTTYVSLNPYFIKLNIS